MTAMTIASLVIATIIWIILTFMLWRSRRWLLFYLTGAFGFTLLMMFAAVILDWDTWLEAIEAAQVAAISAALGMGVDLLGKTGLAIPNHTGWAVFDVGIECSALLEMSAIVGLTMFYPAFNGGRKLLTAGIGTVATYIANIMRILLIVAIINAFGTNWVFAAHAVFGRVFFFIATIALYWYLITRPTVHHVRNQIAEEPEGGSDG